MSGGSLCDYGQYKIGEIAREVLKLIQDNEKGYYEGDYYDPETNTMKKRIVYGYDDEGNEITDKPEGWARYTPETIRTFKHSYLNLIEAELYAHRIDWLISGDDSEESFSDRVGEDMLELKNHINILVANNWKYQEEDIESTS